MADNYEASVKLVANIDPLVGPVGPEQADTSEHVAYAAGLDIPAEQTTTEAVANPRAKEAGGVLGKLAAARGLVRTGYARAGIAYVNSIERAVGKLPQSKAGFAGVAAVGLGMAVGTKLGISELGHHAATITSSGHEHLSTNIHLLSDESASPTPSPSGSVHESASATASATGTPKATPTPTISGSGSPSPNPSHGAGHLAATPNHHVSDPTNPATGTQEHVTVLDAKQTGKLHRVWATAKKGITPNGNFMTKFIPGKHGTTTIKLAGMHPGGTMIDGQTVNVRGANNLEVINTVRVNGHEETVINHMDGNKLTGVPNKELNHSVTTEVGFQDPNHPDRLDVISTVADNGKPVSGHHQLDKLIADYRGTGQSPASPPNPATHDVLSTTNGDTHAALLDSHSVEITHNNEIVRISLPDNVLAPDGSHHVNIAMPTTGVTFENDHWQVTHAAEIQINRELASHGLLAVFKTDGSHNVLGLRIVPHGVDMADLTAPTGYDTSYLRNHNELQFTLPEAQGGGNVHVPLPLEAYKTGQLDLHSATMHRAIIIAFRQQQHLTAIFHNEMMKVTKGTKKADVIPSAAATRTPKIRPTPTTSTVSPSSQSISPSPFRSYPFGEAPTPTPTPA